MHAARGYLARLVVVVAVLAGLGLAAGLQCTDGMAVPLGGHAAAATVMVGDGPELMTSTDAEHPPVSGVASGSHGMGGVMAACLVLLVVAVVAVAGLARPELFRMADRVYRSVRVAASRAALPRASSLAELCVLRT
jgi:hypothetical protein